MWSTYCFEEIQIEGKKMTEKNMLRISASTKNPDNSVIWMPYTYRDTAAAVKEIISNKRAEAPEADRNKVGGFVKGETMNDNFWFINKLSPEETAVLEAASEKDFALGVSGRKDREETLKAERLAAKEQASAETKDARAQANRERAAKRNDSRVVVEAGSIALGDKVEKDGESHEVNHIGSTFENDGKQVAYAYFGELGAELAAKAAEAEKEEEPDMGM
jgi:hypothetical protein